MPTPSPIIVHLLIPFAVALTRPALAKLAWLVQGGILAPGRRTVGAALAACGLGQTPHFTTDLARYDTELERALDLIAEADWVIDLGPEGGEAGGRIVAQGTPEQVAQNKHSHTGCFLHKVLTHQQ